MGEVRRRLVVVRMVLLVVALLVVAFGIVAVVVPLGGRRGMWNRRVRIGVHADAP